MTRVWVVWGISVVLYLALNALLLKLQFIPGMASFIGFGFVMPVLLVIGWWIVSFKIRRESKSWWLPGMLSTVVYLGAGWVTISVIASIWAAI
ncbi:MAG: hypothetical protein HKN23_16485 [Verrucomicrobiales bacterium]|nr:hypothetical protein [Verrucomicrobiales bacterium]